MGLAGAVRPHFAFDIEPLPSTLDEDPRVHAARYRLKARSAERSGQSRIFSAVFEQDQLGPIRSGNRVSCCVTFDPTKAVVTVLHLPTDRRNAISWVLSRKPRTPVSAGGHFWSPTSSANVNCNGENGDRRFEHNRCKRRDVRGTLRLERTCPRTFQSAPINTRRNTRLPKSKEAYFTTSEPLSGDARGVPFRWQQ